MPIISRTGRRSPLTRLLYASMYLVLMLGAVSMVYPFILMLTGSTTSNADRALLKPYPAFWFDDTVLFQKFAESKYNESVQLIEAAWGETVPTYRSISPPPTIPPQTQAFIAWREESSWWTLGHCGGTGEELQYPQNARRFRARLVERYNNRIERMREALGTRASSWTEVYPPSQGGTRFRPEAMSYYDAFSDFADTRPPSERIYYNPDGEYVFRYLIPKYSADITAYNASHNTSHASYSRIVLSETPPANPLERTDWEAFVRERARLSIIRLLPEAEPSFRSFLSQRYGGSILTLNEALGTDYESFQAVPFSTRVPGGSALRADWQTFLADPIACPASYLRVQGPRQSFEAYLARHAPGHFEPPVFLPIRAADWLDMQQNRSALKWEFTTRSYKHVLEYLLYHGRGLRNTLIYCFLAVLGALIVNPLAAYGLSRYHPPRTYLVLLICMAVMAFPGEITMIPAFLLMKRFPALPLLTACAVFLAAAWLLDRSGWRLQSPRRWGTLLAVALLAGFGLLPALAPGASQVSLLNTFWALVLPGLANGFAIFLLKGFFDSLPRELYEAAEIDGASEWTQFWNITMTLSKPILAVIALNAFVGAYTAFMMALIIIPDPKMWTLMVWIFQLQSSAHQSVVFASLVIAAIPTLTVFLFCQNLIIRGIIVPTEK